MTASTESSSNDFSVRTYFDRRMLRILLLGAISGFPWVIIGSALTLWLKEDGLSRSTIGWASLIFGVYAINFWWAPLVDRIRIPVLTDLLGHRKSWIVSMQMIIVLSLVAWHLINPVDNLALVVSVGLIIAICSATQDITIDALRIEQVSENEASAMAAGAAVAVAGWWTGYKLGGLVTLLVADSLQEAGYTEYWQLTFLVICAFMLVLNVLLLLIPEGSSEKRQVAQLKEQQAFATQTKLPWILSWIGSSITGPLVSFFRKNGLSIGIAILAFVFLFKIGEAFMGKMSIVFYKEVGFSKTDIALYSKGLGWITTVAFTLLGGWIALRSGVVRALLYAGIAMAATNVMFSILAWTGKSEWLFALSVVIDDIAGAFATVAFVTFISMLVDRTYTATQYALLASIGTAGRTLFASSSGALVDWLDGDWGVFFIITALMVIPSLLLLWYLRNKLKLNGMTTVDAAMPGDTTPA